MASDLMNKPYCTQAVLLRLGLGALQKARFESRRAAIKSLKSVEGL